MFPDQKLEYIPSLNNEEEAVIHILKANNEQLVNEIEEFSTDLKKLFNFHKVFGDEGLRVFKFLWMAIIMVTRFLVISVTNLKMWLIVYF